MNCRDFLAEFEERSSQLSQPAQLHLNDCPDCVKTSGEQTRVWQMIDELRRVDAPKNFDFRVKSRIAKSKPVDFSPRFSPALRYVLPLGLVILILGLVVFNTTYFSGINSPQIVENVPPTQNEKDISPINSFSTNQFAATEMGNKTPVAEIANLNVEPTANNQDNQSIVSLAAKSPAKSRTKATKKNEADDGGGSHVLSAKRPESPRLPLGFEQRQPIKTLPNADNQIFIADVRILEFIGIETVSDSGGRKVKSVKSDSLADISGVEIGDIVEAIDGKKISDETRRSKTIEGKTLTVKRGDKKIEINLQNKSN